MEEKEEELSAIDIIVCSFFSCLFHSHHSSSP